MTKPPISGLFAYWKNLVKSEIASKTNNTVMIVRNTPRDATPESGPFSMTGQANRRAKIPQEPPKRMESSELKRPKRFHSGRSSILLSERSALQELPDRADQRFLLLVHHHVPGILDQLELAVLDPARELLRIRRRNQLVVVAPQ